MSVSEYPLAAGGSIPALGLGTYPMMDDAEPVVAAALEMGYRLVDTAQHYGNEEPVGHGIRASGVPREEVFVTTKFDNEWQAEDRVRDTFENSSRRLGVDYIDLLLIHWPNPWLDKYVDAWRGMIRLREEGLVRHIGVSNFKPAHLQRLIDETGVAPEVNQVELNPYVPRRTERAFHAEHGTVTQAWAPLAKAEELLGEEQVKRVASELGRTPAQVVLRWHLQLGNVAIPKSARVERVRENFDVFDFELSSEQMASLATLETPTGQTLDSDEFGH